MVPPTTCSSLRSYYFLYFFYRVVLYCYADKQKNKREKPKDRDERGGKEGLGRAKVQVGPWTHKRTKGEKATKQSRQPESKLCARTLPRLLLDDRVLSCLLVCSVRVKCTVLLTVFELMYRCCLHLLFVPGRMPWAYFSRLHAACKAELII